MGKDTRTPEQVRADRKAQLEAMHVQLTEAVEGLVTGQDWREALQFAARFRKRSFNNLLLIRSQHLRAYHEGRVPEPVPTYVAGFKQWKQLGRTPQPGAYKIYAPIHARYASATPQDPSSWRKLAPREKPQPGESVISRKTGNKAVAVWDVSQTTGKPLPERPRPQLLHGQAPAGLWDGLAKLVAEEGYRLLDAPEAASLDGADGMTNLQAKTVHVRLDLDDMDRCATLAHELGHVVLLAKDRPGAVRHVGMGEVEAESFSLTLIWTEESRRVFAGCSRATRRRVVHEGAGVWRCQGSGYRARRQRRTNVTRADCLEFGTWLTTVTNRRTGRPLAASTRRGDIQVLHNFFRDGYSWQWPHMPDRPMLMNGDMPKVTQPVPRFIPDEELTVLMDAIRDLTCPFQRAALLIAQWSGARRSEIRMLELDCLDTYPDGTPRLRLAASKNYAERTVPLMEEAAEAIRTLQKLRRDMIDQQLPGNHNDRAARRLFVRQGRVLSNAYLFDDPLAAVCTTAGLTTPDGKPTISAHRFRHTVGTQLAERGARLQTIMSILGHKSVQMALVYAHVSDPAVLDDYRAVLGAEATIAGPSAAAVRNRELTDENVEWIKDNFLRTELELGHCLRLPAEGPCECDLFLTCAKFITTPKYAPRLRDRHATELALAERARNQGWAREVERHEATARRICQLLTDLDEPLVHGPPAGTG